MAGLFGGSKVDPPKAPAAPPRLSEGQVTSKEAQGEMRKRRGIEDQIFTLGRPSRPGYNSMLGSTTAQ